MKPTEQRGILSSQKSLLVEKGSTHNFLFPFFTAQMLPFCTKSHLVLLQEVVGDTCKNTNGTNKAPLGRGTISFITWHTKTATSSPIGLALRLYGHKSKQTSENIVCTLIRGEHADGDSVKHFMQFVSASFSRFRSHQNEPPFVFLFFLACSPEFLRPPLPRFAFFFPFPIPKLVPKLVPMPHTQKHMGGRARRCTDKGRGGDMWALLPR